MIGFWRIAAGLGFGLGMAGAGSPAFAAVCDINPQGVSFNNYDPLESSDLDGVGNVNIRCDVVTPFSVSFGQGQGAFAQRRMVAGADWLGYNLYTDASRSIIWGDGVSGSTVSATGDNVDLPIYGRIPAGQNVAAGLYSDSITVTVTY